jgi:TrmH family RNA methyltransferase
LILSKRQRQRIVAIARGRSDEPLHVLEGRKAILDATRAGHVVELWVSDDLDGELGEVRDAARKAGVPVGIGTLEDFRKMGEAATPQPLLALVRDTAAPLDEIAARRGLLLWLDGLQDPGNVGAVFRVAAAFGAAGVLVGRGSADPLGGKALRASAGLALSVPFARGSAAAIGRAVVGRPVFALDMGGEDVRDLEAPADVVLVLGAEGRGLGPEAQAGRTRTVGIPLAAGVESLNVAVAAGIAVASLTHRRSS